MDMRPPSPVCLLLSLSTVFGRFHLKLSILKKIVKFSFGSLCLPHLPNRMIKSILKKKPFHPTIKANWFWVSYSDNRPFLDTFSSHLVVCLNNRLSIGWQFQYTFKSSVIPSHTHFWTLFLSAKHLNCPIFDKSVITKKNTSNVFDAFFHLEQQQRLQRTCARNQNFLFASKRRSWYARMCVFHNGKLWQCTCLSLNHIIRCFVVSHFAHSDIQTPC